MNEHDTPTPAEMAQARAEFVALCTEYSYTEAVKIMGIEYARGHKLATWQAVQCEGKTKPPAGVAAGRHIAPKAKQHVFANLHANTSR